MEPANISLQYFHYETFNFNFLSLTYSYNSNTVLDVAYTSCIRDIHSGRRKNRSATTYQKSVERIRCDGVCVVPPDAFTRNVQTPNYDKATGYPVQFTAGGIMWRHAERDLSVITRTSTVTKHQQLGDFYKGWVMWRYYKRYLINR